MTSPEYDLIVIGAGFCGSVLAIKAAGLGLRVKVVDTQRRYPDHFRAEKLENDQFEALTAFDLIDRVRPKESPSIEWVHTLTGKRETKNRHKNHRGISYCDTVNAFRDVLEERQLLAIRKISEISDGPDSCRITFDDGERLHARLVALATGMAAGFRKSLGLESRDQATLVSTTFGFDTELHSAAGLPYAAVNIRPDRFVKGLQYMTFFPVGERLRANLFTCWEPHSAAAKAFKADPLAEFARLFPGEAGRIGSFSISTDLQAYTTRYYRMSPAHLRRIVLTGDAFQSVSPATGMGLSKCLVDAQVLADLLPQLLEDPGAGLNLEDYYRDERKKQADDLALGRWQWANELATSRSPKTRLKKLKRRVTPAIRAIVG